MCSSSVNSNPSINWNTVVIAGSAFAAYEIGAGFLTGAEVMEFYSSWGGYWLFILVALSIPVTAYFCSCCFRVGQAEKFAKDADAFRYFCGKRVGHLFDAFTVILIFGFVTGMYAGSGAAINQYSGIPVYIGAGGMGIISVTFVCLGLKRVITFLGYSGVIIALFVFFISLLAIFHAEHSFIDAQSNLQQYIKDGKFLQANLFGVSNPLFSAFNYVGILVITSTPFLIATGRIRTSNAAEAHAGGLLAGVLFFAGITILGMAIIFNLDYIAAKDAQVPMLAIVMKVFPAASAFFVFIIILGILTTVTGELWLITGRFTKDKTTESRILAIVLASIGVFGGSVIPFGNIIKLFWPFAGLIGMILFGFIAAKDIALHMKKNN